MVIVWRRLPEVPIGNRLGNVKRSEIDVDVVGWREWK